MNDLSYDIVIATRNRIDALKMSIPLMLSQSRQAQRLIVVDASDDHENVNSAVLSLCKGWAGQVIVLNAPPNSAGQRNYGLQKVEADIVIFPDDDSLWHPGVAESIMQTYEMDKAMLIGGVCGKPTTVSPMPPHSFTYAENQTYQFKTKIQPLRNWIEAKLIGKPFELFAHEKWPLMPKIEWIDQVNYVLVENMAGFRMSFRADLFKQICFDESLGAEIGYAMHEDMDASLAVLSRGYHLVAALNANVYHHAHLSPRAHPYSYGYCQIANYFFIVAKHTSSESKTSRAAIPFLLYKVVLYATSSLTRNGRQTFQGALAGWRAGKHLLDVPKETLSETYFQIVKAHRLRLPHQN